MGQMAQTATDDVRCAPAAVRGVTGETLAPACASRWQRICASGQRARRGKAMQMSTMEAATRHKTRVRAFGLPTVTPATAVGAARRKVVRR
jgi:hypothetical protein